MKRLLARLFAKMTRRVHRSERKSLLPRARLNLECLEARTLMAGSITSSAGVIRIEGTASADTAQVSLNNMGTSSALDDRVVITLSHDGHSHQASYPLYRDTFLAVGDLLFNGYDGNDRFTNLTNIRSTAYGGYGNDTLTGGDGRDTLYGGTGSLALFPPADNDVMNGGKGDDSLDGEGGNDWMYGGYGADTVNGGGGNDTLYGGTGAAMIGVTDAGDVLHGGTGNDSMLGEDGIDILQGEGGNDTLLGGYGDDWLFGGDGRDSLDGGANNDLLMGDNLIFSSAAVPGDDTMFGGSGNDTLYGDAGYDRLNGGTGNDTLDGGLGSDYLEDLSGTNVLYGGGGNNTTVTAAVSRRWVNDQAGFGIAMTFTGLTPAQIRVFHEAALRWEQIITGDLPDAIYLGSVIVDDLLIAASAVPIDGVGNVLGQAGPDALRGGSFLPFHGAMEFDTADLGGMSEATLRAVILHEIGHVLGIGTIWQPLGLLTGAGTSNPRFIGAQATAAYNAIFGVSGASVPVENTGGPGTANGHWRESVFGAELMTGWIDTVNPLSRVTAASLADLGYAVNLSAADFYVPPGSISGSAAIPPSVLGPTLLRAAGDGSAVPFLSPVRFHLVRGYEHSAHDTAGETRPTGNPPLEVPSAPSSGASSDVGRIFARGDGHRKDRGDCESGTRIPADCDNVLQVVEADPLAGR